MRKGSPTFRCDLPKMPFADAGRVDMSEGERPLWSPLKRLTVFSVGATVVCLLGALTGAIAGIAWLAWEQNGVLKDWAQFEPSAKFFLFAAIATSIYAPLTLFTLAFARSVDKLSLTDIGLPPERWGRQLLSGVAVGVAFVAVMFGLYAIAGWVRFSPTSSTRWLQWFVFTLWLCPLIGFAEEMVFRGYLLKALEEWKGRLFAVVVSSVLFWSLHLGQGNAHELPGIIAYIATGVIFAVSRYCTGGLWFPIGLHISYNWSALTFGGDADLGIPSLTHYELRVPPHWVGPPGHVGWVDAAFYLLLLTVFALWWRQKVWGKEEASFSSNFSEEKLQQ